ncbi:MAG: hypothetical protein JSW63_07845, partial [Ignavibacterium sp.]
MQIKSKIIRDLAIIEKELNSIISGVIMLPLDDEVKQVAANFIYHDKNVYIYIQEKELYDNLKFDTGTMFTAIKNPASVSKAKKSNESIYSLFYISVSGVIKKVTEKKLKNIIRQSFIQKYSGQLLDSESKSKSFSRLVVLDTEEMIATEEIG